MAVVPRAALDRLVAALEAHFEAIVNRRSETDPRVDDAYDALADAFDAYDDALAREYGEVTPFLLVDDEDHDDDDHDEHHDDYMHEDLDEDAEMLIVDGDSVVSAQTGGKPAKFGFDA